MAKITLSDVNNLNNQTSAQNTINNNSELIEIAIENTLSRDGTSPNEMNSDLDMNGYLILNSPEPSEPTHLVRLKELNDVIPDINAAGDAAVAEIEAAVDAGKDYIDNAKAEAAASAAAAAISETNSANSANDSEASAVASNLSAVASEVSATNSQDSAADSENSANASAASAAAAASSEAGVHADALAAEAAAADSASSAEAAGVSEANSATSATNSQNSANASAASATAADGSADAAALSATSAGNSATAASSSATAADGFASEASDSAAIATAAASSLNAGATNLAGGTAGQVATKNSNADYDFTWTDPATGSGSVSSVAMTVPTGLSVAGTPITTSGTFVLGYAAGYQGYTTAEANKLAGIAAGAQVNTITSVAGKTGAVTLVKGDVGLGNVDNTSDANKPVSTAMQTALNLKADKAGGTINASDYGVVGDGVTVNTTGLQNALNAASAQGGGTVVLPTGVVVSGSINLPAKVTLQGAGRDATTLQLDGNPATFVTSAGSLAATVALASNALKGATSLTLASASGIASGDYLQLTDNFSYTSTDAGYKSGETVRVLSVAGAVVQLYSPIAGSRAASGTYTTANSAKIAKVTPILAPSVKNMTIAGVWTSTTRLIFFDKAIGAVVSDIFIRDHGAVGVQYAGCIDSTVYQCSFDNLRDDIANGFSGYGVAISGPCDNIQVHNNSFSRSRHGFTTMGGAAGFPHRVLVSSNQCVDNSLSGIDVHDSGDGFLIEGNTVFASRGQGITIRSTNTVVRGNRVTNSGSHGIACSEENLSDVSILDNIVIGALNHGISCGQPCPNLTIRGNEVSNSGQDGIYVFGDSTVDSPGLVISGNFVRNVGLVGTGRVGISVGGTVASTNGLVEKNTVEQSTGSATYAINLAGLSGAAVLYNNAKGTFTTSAFNTTGSVSLNNLVVDGSVGNVQMDPTTAAIRTTGAPANIDLLILPKGTGVLRFGTWATGSGSPNGYITIKDAGGTIRKLATIA